MRPQDCTFEALFRGPHSALLEPQICIGGAHGGAPRLHFWSPTVFLINTLPAVPASPVWRSGNQALRHLHRPYTTGWRRRCSRRSPSCKVPGILHPSQFSQQDTTAVEEKVTAAEEEAAAKEERQSWLENQFSWWDGRHTELSELIKENLNDSGSFEHVNASYIDVSDEENQAVVNQTLAELGFSERVEVGDLFVIEEFTAKNAFNATIKNMAFGIVRGSDDSVLLLGII